MTEWEETPEHERSVVHRYRAEDETWERIEFADIQQGDIIRLTDRHGGELGYMRRLPVDFSKEGGEPLCILASESAHKDRERGQGWMVAGNIGTLDEAKRARLQ
jgi:hypothetical protein